MARIAAQCNREIACLTSKIHHFSQGHYLDVGMAVVIRKDRTDGWPGTAIAMICRPAAENTVITAYANNTNTHYMDGRPVRGQSLVSGPSGDTLLSADEKPQVLTTSLDIASISKQRQRWPYVEDIRKFLRSSSSPITIRELE